MGLPFAQELQASEATSGLRLGDHLCWLYESQEDFTSFLTPFVEQGVDRNEKIIYCYHGNSEKEIQQTLSPFLPRLDAQIENGQLVFISAERWFFDGGEFVVELAIGMLTREIEQALAEGYSGLRMTCEMNWVLEAVPGSLDLIEYEAKLNEVVQGADCILMCQYQQDGFELATLLDVLATHPVVALGTRAYENMYYLPPGNLRSSYQPASALSHSFATLKPNRDTSQHLESRREELVSSMDSLLMLESILGSMSDGVVVSDEHTNILMVNKAAKKLLGFGNINISLAERAKTYGYFLADGVTPHPIDELPLLRAIRGEVISNYEMCIKNTTRGKGVWLSINALPLKDRFRGLKGGVVVMRDITEQRRAAIESEKLEIKLRQSQKLECLGVLSGGIAHDFNNMLAGIMGNVGLLLMETDLDSPYRNKLEQIRLGAERASELTNQLLAYSGKGNFEKTSIDVTHLVSEMSDLLSTAISKKAKLRFDFQERLPAIEADATQIRQVVMNLITNASDAVNNNGGTIFIRTGVMFADKNYLTQTYLTTDLTEGDYVYFEVEDTGYGMDTATQAKIFDPFYTTKFIGRGLGLAAVLGIVQGSRGAIRLKSSPGKGTVFRVLFPSTSKRLPEKVSIRSFGTDQSRESCGLALVVDDEDSVRGVVSQMLEAFGFSVLSAAGGLEAVEIYRQRGTEIDLVLLDMTMPDINGDEAFRRIKGINKEASVILMSGYTETDAEKQFPDLVPAGFLQKPYGPEILLERVQGVMDARSDSAV